ncbi:hypothetical protein IW294_22605 [Streptomyces olivaceus]|uniref:hypothetical protein n=1 Tax=Streptomyces olivaceus TaxID=47716 RepID=UPI0018A832D9|nr:hypothetical protein [Streptomyces olivaceus]MBF8173540.1 hypothetical protein [Streptomyces olivaceus]
MADDAFTGVESELGITAACRLTGRSRATHYRRLRPAPERKPRKPQVQPSALTPEERAAVLELMNPGEYAELPPAPIWTRELDAGRYHCSVSTMYRILGEKGQSGERRRQATHPAKTVPELVATAPSQVFAWDRCQAAHPSASWANARAWNRAPTASGPREASARRALTCRPEAHSPVVGVRNGMTATPSSVKGAWSR